ncbi:hypothetical protein JL193_01005 [Polaribacter batillariae]|uniref:NVEALA protein n=1 Tax=Polaribacter batillariae TaxID=2808900 RepID=A0ABX7SYP9_9FLAO|nr:hypothetical protein [Polaribacter batillariae]QTD37919.1 hypothetical protein JL193_01005 [Polaribacter batillariae]
MKKLIGILGVAAIAMAMFFSANTNNVDNSDLASLFAVNTANAEVTVSSDQCSYIGHHGFSCTDGPFTFTGCISDPTLGCSGTY